MPQSAAGPLFHRVAVRNPILDMNGKPVKVVKYATDITAEINANRMLREAVEQAQLVTTAARDGDLTQRITRD